MRVFFVWLRRGGIVAVVLVDDIFSVRLNSRCAVFRDKLNIMVHVKNMGKLRWCGGYHYTRERERGTLATSQMIMFDDKLVRTFVCDFRAECSTSSWCKTIRVL